MQLKRIVLSVLIALTCTACAQTSGNVPLTNWTDTIQLEHSDRLNRLKRLAALEGFPPPAFYTETIHAGDIPGINVDIPVLRVVFPERVFFETGSSTITPDADVVLNIVSESLRREPPDVSVFIAGHTDSRGTDSYNYALSVDRADSVAHRLIEKGVGQAVIWRIGFGEKVPIVPNTSAANMAQNRRVEFLFAAKQRAITEWLSRQKIDACSSKDDLGSDHCKKNAVQSISFEALSVSTPQLHSGKVAVNEASQTTETNTPLQSVNISPQKKIVVTLTYRPQTVVLETTN